MIPIMLGVLFIIFTINSITPGDPAMAALGTNYTEEAYQAKLVEMGLDKPFVIQYVIYIKNIVTRFDLGTSYTSLLPVSDMILGKIGVTLRLGIISCVITVTIGLVVGVISAVRQYSALDYTATTLSIIFSAIPGFWLALIGLIVFSVKLGWFPASGLHTWKHYVMPVICMALSPIAVVIRMTRSSMLDVIRQDYIRTARAKGVMERKVIFRHALKNALIPVLTVIGMQLTMVIGGSVIIESIFSIPGMGTLMMNAINGRDYPVTQGVILMLSFVICVINLLVDITYSLVDPRIMAQFTGKNKQRRRTVKPAGAAEGGV